MYMLGFGGGPNRPSTPAAGLNGVPAAALLVARFQRADVALKAIGIVEPGSAWMFVSCVGSVKLMMTNAFALPVTCHAPAVAAVGCSVVATPLITVPKLRSRSVVSVIPVVTTTASAATDVLACAAACAGRTRSATHSSAFLTGQSPARSRARTEPSARVWNRGRHDQSRSRSDASNGRAATPVLRLRSQSAAAS